MPKTQPCPVCGDPCPVKTTHKGKPYWQCEPCGVQVFVRRQAGIARLEGRPGGRERESEGDFFGER